MPMILEQFISQIGESGILSAEDVAAFLKSQSTEIDSVEELSSLLVEHNKLTPYQAQMICEGRGQKLLLGNYLIRDRIGGGGMGDVYLAEHRRMERLVALKMLPAVMSANEQSIQRFHREVKAVARLNHPHIVTAYDADEYNQIHFLVMEYVPGTNLSACVKTHGPFPVDQALNLILQAARGLEYAHEQGIIHRDIKPANILLDNSGTVKVLDMGLARIDNPNEEHTVTSLTESGSMMGTIDFMSPEQALNTHSADRRSDIYSLGCSFYFLLTGDPVYSGTSVISKILAHREQAIPSLCHACPEIPPAVDALYQKMIAKEPADRFQTMQEVIEAIQECLPQNADSSPSMGSALRPSQQSWSASPEPVKVLPGSEQRTQFFSDSLPDAKGATVNDPVVQGQKGRGPRGWMLAGTLLASLVLLAGFVLYSGPPAATVVLDLDQPDLAGAVVSVDDQRAMIVKSGTGLERVRIPADGKSHTVQVLKNGYETFTKQFTMKAGQEETVRVQLNALPAAGNQSLPENYALEFDGESSAVELPGLKYDGTHPFTLEATIRPLKRESEQSIDVALMMGNVNFRVSVLEENGLSRFLVTSGIKGEKHIRLFSHPVKRTVAAHHVAAIYDGTQIRLYVNGEQTHYSVEVSDKQNNYTPMTDSIELEQVYTNAIFQIGRTTSNPTSNHSFRGIIDEVRLSSIVRYTNNFTPEKRLKADEHTMGLYHFDEVGSNVLKDSSGNGRDGRIIGARWVTVDDQLNVIE
ncbi:protein kinase domain-containing protein [Gimesia sp.]|uniref:protein kinase domain-containing protein n=1 Tax=Gimesia sp. TaxID=2024833 RepID=UPI003A8DEC5A